MLWLERPLVMPDPLSPGLFLGPSSLSVLSFLFLPLLLLRFLVSGTQSSLDEELTDGSSCNACIVAGRLDTSAKYVLL